MHAGSVGKAFATAGLTCAAWLTLASCSTMPGGPEPHGTLRIATLWCSCREAQFRYSGAAGPITAIWASRNADHFQDDMARATIQQDIVILRWDDYPGQTIQLSVYLEDEAGQVSNTLRCTRSCDGGPFTWQAVDDHAVGAREGVGDRVQP